MFQAAEELQFPTPQEKQLQNGMQAMAHLPALQQLAGDSASQPGSPLPSAQTLRHRHRADSLKRKNKGIRGILPFTRHVDRKVALESPLEDRLCSSSCAEVLSRRAKDSKAECRVATEGKMNGSQPSGDTINGAQDTLEAVHYLKHQGHERLLLQSALQQSFQQIKACISQFEEQKHQQEDMQMTLQNLTTNCHFITKLFFPQAATKQQ